jgi:hypothetical protein
MMETTQDDPSARSEKAEGRLMPSAKKRPPIVPAKVKAAISVLFEQSNYDLEAAAKAARLTTFRLREEMKKAHVQKWMWHEKRALIEAICAGNPAALAKIRDTSGNDMAKVGAIKTSEIMRESLSDVRNPAAAHQAPGFVILIQTDGAARIIEPQTPMIEARPVPDGECELEPLGEWIG